MKKRTILPMLALLLAAGPLAAQTTWITAGKMAYPLVKDIPGIKVLDSKTAASIAGTERVYLMAVPTTALSKVSQLLHEKLLRCGGFMHHADESSGRRALEQHATPPAPAYVTREGSPDYEISNKKVVVPLLASMKAAAIGETIRDLSAFPNRLYSSPHGVEASQWLLQKWSASAAKHGGMTVEQLAHAGYPQRSVVATIPGSDLASEVVVLGAHLDSINTSLLGDKTEAPGADDDASGVAGLTEIIRVLSDTHYRPRRTIKFMAYAAEEVGLRGSQEIARDFRKRKVNVVGVFQLDMINYQGKTADIFLLTDYTDRAQNTFLANLIQTYLPTLKVGVEICGYACSDHASWQAEGYAVSMAIEGDMAELNPHMHSKRDTYVNSGSQAAHALKFARLGAAYAVELGSSQAKRAVP